MKAMFIALRQSCAFVVAIAGLLACSGCGTLSNVVHQGTPEYYGGVAYSIGAVGDGCDEMRQWCASSISPFFGTGGSLLGGGALIIFGIIDTPLSLAGDTITLPYVFLKRPKD